MHLARFPSFMNSMEFFLAFGNCPACQILKPALCCDGSARQAWRDAHFGRAAICAVFFMPDIEKLSAACFNTGKFWKD